MHQITRENALPLNLLPTLLLAIVLSKLPTVIIQRGADNFSNTTANALPSRRQ